MAVADPQGAGPPVGPGRVLLVYARWVGPLLGGYLLFDRAFAYLHVPGTPVFVGELLLAVGALGVLSATAYLLVPVRDEPILALLVAFSFWGILRTIPGVAGYGMDAVRDAALWYYCGFAFLAVAATARLPNLPEVLVEQLGRLLPWLLAWLPVGLLLAPLFVNGPYVPFSTESLLSHKAGNAAIAAVLALGAVWLFPGGRHARVRTAWSLMAFVVIALAATQNRGGLLGAAAGVAVGLALARERLRLVVPAVLALIISLALCLLLAVRLPIPGPQGRDFSASQLLVNVASLGGKESGNLGGTVEGREQLWSRILDKQRRDGLLLVGSGFGPNLASDVGVLDAGKDTLRNPHNSHLNVLARMGVVGFALWIALWLGWYRRLAMGCRRLARDGLEGRRRTAVLCLAVATSILVSSAFDPQLEGPQVAALLWTTVGIGVAVTSRREWAAEVVSTSWPRAGQARGG